jgi:Ca-activated chloride channel family protein
VRVPPGGLQSRGTGCNPADSGRPERLPHKCRAGGGGAGFSPAVARTAVALVGFCLLCEGRPSWGHLQFRTGVDLVDVYVTVTDERGALVEELARSDFTLLEDGREQRLDTFAAGGLPLSVALAIDRSFSVAGRRLEIMKAASRRFVEALAPTDALTLVGIGSRVEDLAPLSHDRAAARRALDRLDAFGSTSLHDAVIASIDRIHAAKGRRALILLSDGVDRYSRATARDVFEHARRHDVLVFPVAVMARRPALFNEVAAVTGGRALDGRDAVSLAGVLRSIARELRAQYLLGYVSSRAFPTRSEWRTIEVRVRPRMHVRARPGYWTPAPP